MEYRTEGGIEECTYIVRDGGKGGERGRQRDRRKNIGRETERIRGRGEGKI
jgi:hypothetical protein